MEVSHTPVDIPTPRDAWTALKDLPQRVNSLLKKYESSNACGFEDFEREVSAPETALLTCGEEGLLEGIWRQGGGVETGRQQGFDLGE